ncbi:ribosome-associated translation inhibitor RaiA [Candidatus Uhrbacteria bacterium]|nr:ribosome-associated translation inhibitor RaiA [Candidatus Uhrbacteria bacterium]
MTIASIKSTNMDMTDAIRGYVEKRLASLDKIAASYGPAVEVRVEVGKTTRHHAKGPYMKAEFTMDIPGAVLRVEREHEDLYAAIDEAAEELKRQLVDQKEKRDDRHMGARPDKE